MRLLTPGSKSLEVQEVTSIPDFGRSAGRSDEKAEGESTDADLSRIMAAWPNLPEPIRKAMLALVAAGG